MESKFIPTLQVGNGYTYLKLRGVLDEDNLLANLLSQIQGRLLLIDMAEMDRINSCGVRDWVNWLNQIQALGLQVILLRCSPAVVAQANMVTNFAAEAFIHSFYAPYVHPDTGEEQSVLLFTEDLRQVRPIRAPKIYNDNGEELEFDEFEESYFAFVSDPRMMNYQVPADVQSVIQYFMPEAATHQPVIQTKSAIANAVPVGSVPAVSTVPATPNVGPAAMANMNSMSGTFSSAPSAAYGGQRPAGGNPAYGGVTSPSGNSVYQNNAYNQVNSFSKNAVPQVPQPSVFNRPAQNPPAPVPAAPAPMPAAQPMTSGAPLPTPSAPVRHEQPPLPTNQGYQHLQANPTAPTPAPSAPKQPLAQTQALPPEAELPKPPAAQNHAANPAPATDVMARPQGANIGRSNNDTINGIPKKNIMIFGIIFVVLILILLVFIVIKLVA